MIIGHGVDVVEVQRVKAMLKRQGARLYRRVLTEAELRYVRKHRDAAVHLAGRLAAKEAVFKAFGVWNGHPATWKEIEVVLGAEGRPHVRLEGRAKAMAKACKVNDIFMSISHTGDVAIASAVLVRSRAPRTRRRSSRG